MARTFSKNQLSLHAIDIKKIKIKTEIETIIQASIRYMARETEFSTIQFKFVLLLICSWFLLIFHRLCHISNGS